MLVVVDFVLVHFQLVVLLAKSSDLRQDLALFLLVLLDVFLLFFEVLLVSVDDLRFQFQLRTKMGELFDDVARLMSLRKA